MDRNATVNQSIIQRGAQKPKSHGCVWVGYSKKANENQMARGNLLENGAADVYDLTKLAKLQSQSPKVIKGLPMSMLSTPLNRTSSPNPGDMTLHTCKHHACELPAHWISPCSTIELWCSFASHDLRRNAALLKRRAHLGTVAQMW